MRNLKKLLCAELIYQLSSASPRPVRIPAGGDLLWRWFAEINRSRSFHAAGPNPISFAEIAAYASLMRWKLEPCHVEIITALDRTFLQYHAQTVPSAPEGVKALPPISKVPLSAGLLDAMFG